MNSGTCSCMCMSGTESRNEIWAERETLYILQVCVWGGGRKEKEREREGLKCSVCVCVCVCVSYPCH